MSEAVLQAKVVIEEDVLPFALPLELRVSDPELVRELMAHPEGRLRDEYALCALKIGLLALKQARGQIDADTVRREGELLLNGVENRLNLHSEGLKSLLSSSLKDYFDPDSGRFHERVQRLIKKDGELEEVIRRQVGQQDSELCKTLLAHFGKDSPLMKMLSPKESEGLLKSLSDTLNQELKAQRESVLTQFSLDNQESALCRLVKTLTEKHGDVSKDLKSKIDDVVKEFSLDHEESALSRLVKRVTEAQRLISNEFSMDNDKSALSRMSKCLQTTSAAIDDNLTLDKETSALSRLKRELLDLLNRHSETNSKFQEEVKQALVEMKVRREEAQRTPLHGKSFQQQLFDFVLQESQKVGDIANFTADTPGLVSRRKVGDVVIELNQECIAAGARIVLEAKDEAGYSLPSAREEIDFARKNRGAGIGVFVFAKNTAPEGIDPFQRHGDDLFVVWDAEDLSTDLYVRAALMVARALSTRQAKQRDAQAADFVAIEKSINEIEKKAGSLDEIRKSAETISGSAEKILERVRIARKGIEDQVGVLRDLTKDLKQSLQEGDAAAE